MSADTTPATIGKRLQLPDGRWLGYAEYGDPTGKPVIYFHGAPSSRLERHPDEGIAIVLGARIIAAERPGYGLSDFQRRRRLLDWPTDVQALADGLGIERFAVVGYSGGGPYAAACAFKIPQRLTAAAMVCSASPLDAPGATQGMARLNRVGLALARYVPWPLLMRLQNAEARAILRDPERAIDQLASVLSEPDRAVLARPAVRQMLRETLVEAYRTGGRGAAWDDVLFAHRWGFQLRDIAMPVHLWQGARDVLVPPTMGRYLAGAIPNCHATFCPDEGHLLLFDHWREILTVLVA